MCLRMLPVASCLLSLQQKSAISGQTAQFPSPLVLLTPAVIKQHLCLPLKLLSGFQPLKHSITNLIILENKNILEFKGYRDFSNYFLKWLLRFESSSVRTRVACMSVFSVTEEDRWRLLCSREKRKLEATSPFLDHRMCLLQLL